MGEIRTLDSRGDGVAVRWNPDNPREVEAARSMFNSLRGQNYSFFTLDDDDERGELIREFDPAAAKIIAVPRVAGG